MKNKVFLFLLPMVAAAWLCSCHKDPPPNSNPPPIDYNELPPITQTGANTFGCLVDGVVWVPRVALLVPWYDLAASFSEKDVSGVGNITCRVLTADQDDWMQLIFGPTFFQENTYFSSLGQGNATSMQIRIFHGWYQSLKSDSLNNWVKISRIDTVKNIISGEFQFDVYGGQNQSNKIVLSEGRFDLPYYPQ